MSAALDGLRGRESAEARHKKNRKFWIGLARAFGGAVFFSLPLLMTMEMWWLGFYMDRFRLALFMVLFIPFLIILDRYAGFTTTTNWLQDVLDGFVAYGVGMVASLVVLLLLNVVNTDMTLGESVGKVSLQTIPASFGAVLASSQLGGGDGNEQDKAQTGYWAELFLMLAGALFFSFNVAVTEEIILLAFRMTPWHALALAVVSLAMMHAFVYAVEFRGSHEPPEGSTFWGLFLRFSVVGYAIALLVSAYILWTFGRYESGATNLFVIQAVVLGFPAALGAAAARLVI